MRRLQHGLWALGMVFLTFVTVSTAHTQTSQRDWALTLYLGRLSDSPLSETAKFNFDFEDSYFIDLGLSRKLYTFRNYFSIEIEAQIAKHFGDQRHWEFDLLSFFRWLLFPWDAYLDTSVAGGAGVSYATSNPEIEVKRKGKTAKFLGALRFEAAFSLPRTPQWSLVTGIHHRSGAGGLFSNVKGASDAWDIGLRYSF